MWSVIPRRGAGERERRLADPLDDTRDARILLCQWMLDTRTEGELRSLNAAGPGQPIANGRRGGPLTRYSEPARGLLGPAGDRERGADLLAVGVEVVHLGQLTTTAEETPTRCRAPMSCSAARELTSRPSGSATG